MSSRRSAWKQFGASRANPKRSQSVTKNTQRPGQCPGRARGGMMAAGNVSLAAPGGAIRSRAEFGSDYIVEVIRALGIEFAAFNPGSSFRGIHDSLINFGEQKPEVIECLHEEISVAIAHGYAKAT